MDEALQRLREAGWEVNEETATSPRSSSAAPAPPRLLRSLETTTSRVSSRCVSSGGANHGGADATLTRSLRAARCSGHR